MARYHLALGRALPVATVAIALLAATLPATADPWKDESGHGRYGYEHKDGKTEWYESGCKIEEKYGGGSYKKEVHCDGPRYAHLRPGGGPYHYDRPYRRGRSEYDRDYDDRGYDYDRDDYYDRDYDRDPGGPIDILPDDMTSWQHPDGSGPYRSDQQAHDDRSDRSGAGTVGPCREYDTVAEIDGRLQRLYGRACRQPDGSWKFVN